MLLPVYPELTEEQIHGVTDAIREFLRRASALSGVEKGVADLVTHLLERGSSEL
jgi:hypothetical protein